jgi:hypothetical protein
MLQPGKLIKVAIKIGIIFSCVVNRRKKRSIAMTMKCCFCTKQSGKQQGFFDLGLGLGLFLLFSGTAAVITATRDIESVDKVAVAQEQISQSQRYVNDDEGC